MFYQKEKRWTLADIFVNLQAQGQKKEKKKATLLVGFSEI